MKSLLAPADQPGLFLKRDINPGPEIDHQVIQYHAPVLNRHTPLFRYVHSRKVQHFHKRIVRNKRALRLRDLPQLPVKIFSFAFVVYISLRISGGYLNIVESSGQLTRQDFTESTESQYFDDSVAPTHGDVCRFFLLLCRYPARSSESCPASVWRRRPAMAAPAIPAPTAIPCT